MYKLGLDIGGTKINIGIFDENNKLVSAVRLNVNEITDISKDLKNTIAELCVKEHIPYEKIKSCGIGIPGTVSEDGKKVLKAPNISIISKNTAEILEAALGIPVRLVQDSRAAALGEYLCGGGKNANVLICFTLGTGIGTGIVINGKIFNGGLGTAGEIGHVPVCEDGRKCGCGKVGCLEKYAAGLGLNISAKELFGENATSKLLFEKAKFNDEKARKIVNNAAIMLGRTIVSAVNLLSPDCILFSGGLSEEPLYLNAIIEYIKAHCYVSKRLPKIKKAELSELSPLYGAALFPEVI